MQNSQSAQAPREHQVFWPSRTNHSPSRMPLVAIAARSLPALGSDHPWAQISSPEAMRGRKRFFWASVPKANRVGPSSEMPLLLTRPGAPDR